MGVGSQRQRLPRWLDPALGAVAIPLVQIHEIVPCELEVVRALLAANGWGHRVGSIEQFSALVTASQVNAVAVAEGQVIGYARGLTDGQSNGYLSMVVVAAEARRQGIGRALVEHVVAAAPSATWVLRAGRVGATDFFAKVGFVASAIAMERLRAQTDT
jgi:GNAT superfamily N-acetyltransferase